MFKQSKMFPLIEFEILQVTLRVIRQFIDELEKVASNWCTESMNTSKQIKDCMEVKHGVVSILLVPNMKSVQHVHIPNRMVWWIL